MTDITFLRRPVTYKDWRRLYHSVSTELGWHVFFCWQQHKALMDRGTWTLMCRLKRIWDRLQLEGKVRDSSWCEAMLEMLSEWEKKP